MAEKISRKKWKHFGYRFLRSDGRNKDFFLSLFLILFCMALFFWLIPFHIGGYGATRHSARFFPFCITIVLTFLSIMLLYKSSRNSGDEATRSEDKRLNWFTIFCILILFAYYFGIVLIGIVPASILVLFVLIRLFGLRYWLLATLLSTIFVIILFFFFDKIAHIDIARGLLFEGWY